jgi:trehalose 6-phosphate phosphatase
MPERPHWSAQKDALRGLFAARRFGVLSDFDGTLSHFVERPDAAMITPENARALDRLAQGGVVVAFLSGRATSDLRTRFPRPGLVYFGNHGLDYWDDGAVAVVEEARPWHAALETLLEELPPFADPAILVEDKGVTATIHYRAAADPLAASREIVARLRPLCALYGLQLNAGNQVWEIKPPLALNKGTALAAIVESQRLDSVLFLGDDSTDLLAMAELRRLRTPHDDEPAPVRGLSVGVVHGLGSPKELGDFCDVVANGPDDVARLLDWLADQLPVSSVGQSDRRRGE